MTAVYRKGQIAEYTDRLTGTTEPCVFEELRFFPCTRSWPEGEVPASTQEAS